MKWLLMFIVLSVSTGCAALKLSMEKRKLDVQTNTQSAIFLNPLQSPESAKLFLEIHSGVLEFDDAPFRDYLEQEFSNSDSAYQLVDDPTEAHFRLIVHVFNLEKVDPTAAEMALTEGYGGPTVGGATLSAMRHIEFSKPKDFFKALAGALVINAVESAVNSTVKNVTYMLVCDLEVSEMTQAGAIVKKITHIQKQVSDTGVESARIEENQQDIRYRTRIVTTANKANLKLQDARETMFKQMAYAIAGVFAKATKLEPEHQTQTSGGL